MRGLFIKDLKFLKNQKIFLLVLFAFCTYFLVTGENTSFVLGYASAMLATLAISSVNYDEQDNGMSYLLTFPISRKMYVLEKYLYGGLMAVVTVLVEGVLILGLVVAKSMSYSWGEIAIQLSFAFLVPAVMMAVMLPVMIKFGTEKSRVAMLAVIGMILLACYIVKQAAGALGIDIWGKVEQFMEADTIRAVAVFVLFAVGVIVASYIISIGIMKRKQF